MDETGLGRLSEIDQALPGPASVGRWVPDLHMTLWNAGLTEPRFIEEGVRFAEEFLRRFEADDVDLTQDVRSALAAFHAKLGRFETADALFRSWLTADPQWGWGWFRWAECYSFRPWENEHLATKAVEDLDVFDEQGSGYDYVSGWASRFANEVWDAAWVPSREPARPSAPDRGRVRVWAPTSRRDP